MKWIHKLTFVWLFARTLCAFEPAQSDKFYISAEEVVFKQDEIFVSFLGDLMKVHALLSDDQGFYVMLSDIAKNYPYPKYECPLGLQLLQEQDGVTIPNAFISLAIEGS